MERIEKKISQLAPGQIPDYQEDLLELINTLNAKNEELRRYHDSSPTLSIQAIEISRLKDRIAELQPSANGDSIGQAIINLQNSIERGQ